MALNESVLKAIILTHGITFSPEALTLAKDLGIKTQNMVYNMPFNADVSRPQELFIQGCDGYETVVSCVAPSMRDSVKVDIDTDGALTATFSGIAFNDLKIRFVPEPTYYRKVLNNGEMVKKYITSCGYDELNIIPWKGCAISSCCHFCGSNSVSKLNSSESFTAQSIAKRGGWESVRDSYLANLVHAANIAKDDPCFDEHMHVILISGNLPDYLLDKQTEIYAQIAESVYPVLKDQSSEDGIVAVMTPPKDLRLMERLKKVGISRAVFNLEVGNEPWFSRYCPGKSKIGQSHILEALDRGVEMFGYGCSWTNFVFGLEPMDRLFDVCAKLCARGIVPSANVLHIDTGSRLDCTPPSAGDVLKFFYMLAMLYKEYDLTPYYCQKALRTSLINEAFAGRIGSDFYTGEKILADILYPEVLK